MRSQDISQCATYLIIVTIKHKLIDNLKYIKYQKLQIQLKIQVKEIFKYDSAFVFLREFSLYV